MLFLPNQEGYDIFTSYIHQHPITGISHGLGLPISAAGLMVLIYTLFTLVTERYKAESWSRYAIYFILGGYATGYAVMDFRTGLLVITLYGFIMNYTINKMDQISYPFRRTKWFIIGGLLFGLPVVVLEFYSHWYLEGSGSDISQLFNSIYHTPLYGTRALLDGVIKGLGFFQRIDWGFLRVGFLE